MHDPHAALRDQVLAQVLDGPAGTDTALRHAVAENGQVPPDIEPVVRKIHAHAYRVTDEDIAALRKRYDDDHLFEIVVSAAVGASRVRLAAGLAALEGA